MLYCCLSAWKYMTFLFVHKLSWIFHKPHNRDAVLVFTVRRGFHLAYIKAVCSTTPFDEGKQQRASPDSLVSQTRWWQSVSGGLCIYTSVSVLFPWECKCTCVEPVSEGSSTSPPRGTQKGGGAGGGWWCCCGALGEGCSAARLSALTGRE